MYPPGMKCFEKYPVRIKILTLSFVLGYHRSWSLYPKLFHPCGYLCYRWFVYNERITLLFWCSGAEILLKMFRSWDIAKAKFNLKVWRDRPRVMKSCVWAWLCIMKRKNWPRAFIFVKYQRQEFCWNYCNGHKQ